MACQSKTPFDSIESAQDYVRLLSEELTRVLTEFETEHEPESLLVSARHLDAVRLVCYKIQRLQHHLRASGRLLNDLRLLRRLFDSSVTSQREADQLRAVTEERDPLGV
jgi:hypothetical protein